MGTHFSRHWSILPTRLSTKLTFRSLWRTNDGGHRGSEVSALVRLGCCRCWVVVAVVADLCFLGQYVATDISCSQALVAATNEGGQLYGCSEGISESEVLVTEESSDDWEAASDQTEAEDEEADEAIEELYRPWPFP